MQTILPNRLVWVVECFELHARGLRVDFWGWLALLHASLDDPAKSGAVINTNGFAMGTIHECREVYGGFLTRFSLEKKSKPLDIKYVKFTHFNVQEGGGVFFLLFSLLFCFHPRTATGPTRLNPFGTGLNQSAPDGPHNTGCQNGWNCVEYFCLLEIAR